jgi:hypothetical protein
MKLKLSSGKLGLLKVERLVVGVGVLVNKRR